MKEIGIKIINESTNDLPTYESINASGLDLKSNISEPILLKPLERVLIPTGLYIELSEGFEAQIRPRSGLAFKHGITVLNTPGTIDADYRGEIKVLLVNLSNRDFNIEPNTRICQMVVSEYVNAKLIESNEISETLRGEGGFGHTGNK